MWSTAQIPITSSAIVPMLARGTKSLGRVASARTFSTGDDIKLPNLIIDRVTGCYTTVVKPCKYISYLDTLYLKGSDTLSYRLS